MGVRLGSFVMFPPSPFCVLITLFPCSLTFWLCDLHPCSAMRAFVSAIIGGIDVASFPTSPAFATFAALTPAYLAKKAAAAPTAAVCPFSGKAAGAADGKCPVSGKSCDQPCPAITGALYGAIAGALSASLVFLLLRRKL